MKLFDRIIVFTPQTVTSLSNGESTYIQPGCEILIALGRLATSNDYYEGQCQKVIGKMLDVWLYSDCPYGMS